MRISAVHEFGGPTQVTKARKWKQVAHKLLLPATLTSASYTLKTFYAKFLSDFEQFYLNHPDPDSLDLYRDEGVVYGQDEDENDGGFQEIEDDGRGGHSGFAFDHLSTNTTNQSGFRFPDFVSMEHSLV
jgi:hypothetical protein